VCKNSQLLKPWCPSKPQSQGTLTCYPTIQKVVTSADPPWITIGQISQSNSTPFQTFYGTIEVNGQSMLDKGETLRQEAIQEFQDIPPREFFYFVERD